MKSDRTIVVAGATGDLGGRIVSALLARGAGVRALVRRASVSKVATLRERGAAIAPVDFGEVSELAAACAGGDCVVSALSGLRDVIIGAQSSLLRAAVEARVPRFIPSDFAIDFTKLEPGTNRNLDLRREFSSELERAPIAATSILNGMFTELLIGPAPVILFALKRVVYWGDAHQLLDFTSIRDTAAYTAAAALDPSTPRFLRIAGDQKSARGLAEAASAVTGHEFRTFRPGGLRALDALIKITRRTFPGHDAVFPPWQGMQYLRDMFSGQGKLEPLDNERYEDLRWTGVHEILATRTGTERATSANG